MTTDPYPRAAWRTSTYSNGQAECVEITDALPGIIAVRDSKNPHGPALAFGHGQWRAFAAQLKTAGRTAAGPRRTLPDPGDVPAVRSVAPLGTSRRHPR